MNVKTGIVYVNPDPHNAGMFHVFDIIADKRSDGTTFCEFLMIHRDARDYLCVFLDPSEVGQILGGN